MRLVDDDGEAVLAVLVPMSSRMIGNFWMVEMMIFFPPSMNWRRSPECWACPTVALTCAKLLMVSSICCVENAPVRHDDDGVEHRLPVPREAMSWCASHAIEFDLPLPAECWIR